MAVFNQSLTMSSSNSDSFLFQTFLEDIGSYPDEDTWLVIDEPIITPGPRGEQASVAYKYVDDTDRSASDIVKTLRRSKKIRDTLTKLFAGQSFPHEVCSKISTLLRSNKTLQFKIGAGQMACTEWKEDQIQDHRRLHPTDIEDAAFLVVETADGATSLKTRSRSGRG